MLRFKNHCLRSTAILGIFAILGISETSQFSTVLAAAPPTSQISIVVNGQADSDNDLKGSRLSGGTRGPGDLPSLFLLMPQSQAQTARLQPSVYWYLDRDTDRIVELVICKMDARPGTQDHLEYVALPVIKLLLKGSEKKGLHSYDMSQPPLKLKPGIYKFTVTLRMDQGNAAADPFSSSLFRVVPVATQKNLWLDQLDDLCKSLAVNPNDAADHKLRRQMLSSEHVFLTFSAPAGIAAFKGPERGIIEKFAAKAAATEEHLLDSLDPVGN